MSDQQAPVSGLPSVKRWLVSLWIWIKNADVSENRSEGKSGGLCTLVKGEHLGL